MQKNTFSGIQMLRFLAAMLVVITHATGMVGERLLQLAGEHFWRPGISGVDLFFVISGFVMAISSGKLVNQKEGWRTFITHRLIRIVPLYWIATSLKVLLVIVAPSMALNSSIEFGHTIASYLFFPTFDSTGNSVLPVVKVGWTLSYEMFFYFFIALALFMNMSALKLATFVFVACSAANIFSSPEVPLVYGFLNPIMLEFVMGMFVAKYCAGSRTINTWTGVIVVVVCFTIMISAGDLPIWWRWVYWGLPSMFIVAIFVILEPKINQVMPTIFIKLGDSSYSLYLFHTFVVPLIGSILVKLNLINPPMAVLACLLVSPAVCYLIYRWIELPTTKFLRLNVGKLTYRELS